MTKEKLLEISKDLLKTDDALRFLLQMTETEREKLVACISERVDQLGR
jgi:hypothetical protein